MPILANCSIALGTHSDRGEDNSFRNYDGNRSISNTLTKLQVAQTVADDSVKHDGCPAIFSEDSLPVGRLCDRKTSQQFIVESSGNERHFLHAANQKRSTRGDNATKTHSSGIVWLQARSMC